MTGGIDMKNPLGYLGFLGLLGSLCFLERHWAYAFFFCLFLFFRFFWVIPDELFRENVRRSATPAYFTGFVLYLATSASRAVSNDDALFQALLVVSFAASFLVFFLRLAFFSYSERRR
jgi:hypothetical protein